MRTTTSPWGCTPGSAQSLDTLAQATGPRPAATEARRDRPGQDQIRELLGRGAGARRG